MNYRFGFDHTFKFPKDETVLIIGKEGEAQIFEGLPDINGKTRWPWSFFPQNIDRVEFRGNVIAQGNIDYAFAIEGLGSIDFTGFDTSRATSMRGLFRDGYCLESLDLSGFDTSNVTDMAEMFAECDCLESLDLRSFDTSKVTDMSRMFFACENLKSLDLSSFDKSNVVNMEEMFSWCDNLEDLKAPFLFADTNVDGVKEQHIVGNQGVPQEDTEKAIKFMQNGKKHAAEFDEQRLADLNALAAEKGLATEDKELDQFTDSMFGE